MRLRYFAKADPMNICASWPRMQGLQCMKRQCRKRECRGRVSEIMMAALKEGHDEVHRPHQKQVAELGE